MIVDMEAVTISIAAAIMATATAAEISIAIVMAARVSQIMILVHDSRRLLLPLAMHRRVSQMELPTATRRRALNATQTVERASLITLMSPAPSTQAQLKHPVSATMIRSNQQYRTTSTRVDQNSIVHQLPSVRRSHRAAIIRRLHTQAKLMGMKKLLTHTHRQPMVEAAVFSSTIPMDMAPHNRPIRSMHILLPLTMQSKLRTHLRPHSTQANFKIHRLIAEVHQTPHTNTHKHLHSHSINVVEFVFIYFKHCVYRAYV